MRRMMIVAVMCVLSTGFVVTAEDVKPAQPAKPAQPRVVQPAQPVPPRPVTVTAAKMAQLEEDFETLEAHRDVKKAYVKAAEIAVEVMSKRYDLLMKSTGGNTTRELLDAAFEASSAKAQLEIRVAELKEVEVKVKHAKKRLDDAKATGVRPVPGVRPLPVDPKAPDPIPALE